MALRPCRECGHQVSTEAPTCPNCGATDPAGKNSESGKATKKSGCIGPSIVILGIFLLIGWLGSNSPETGNGSKPKEAETPSCKSEWKLCSDNSDLVNHWSGWSNVKVECKMAADETAKYGTPEWPWLYFGKYKPGKDYVSEGIAVAFEDDAKFSNAFGAMAKVRVACTYDLNAAKVIDVDVSQR